MASRSPIINCLFLSGCMIGILIPRPSSADETLKPISTITDVDLKALRNKGLDHFKKKEYALAVEAFQKALAIQRSAGAMAQMASALNALGRYDEALQWYESVLAEFPKASQKLRSTVNTELTELVAKVGTIAVDGDVIKGSRLFVDSRDVGELPLAVPVRVLAGLHEVRAEKPGFASIKTSVEVAAGKPSIAKLVAPKREGKLDIREKHNWRLHIEVDGKDVGLSPLLIPVEMGAHRIRLRGFMGPDALLACETPLQSVELGARMESAEQAVTVGLYETQLVDLSAEDQDALLHIESTPKGATLFIDGQEVGKTPWEARLPLGEHAVQVRANGFVKAEQTVTLEKRKQREISMVLERVRREAPSIYTPRNVGMGIAFGVGAVGLATFVVTGAIAIDEHARVVASCPNQLCFAAANVDPDGGKTLATASTVALLIGGVGAIAGTIVSVVVPIGVKDGVKDKRADSSGIGLNIGPGGIDVVGRF